MPKIKPITEEPKGQKAKSPTPEEIDSMVQGIDSIAGKTIVDRNTFDAGFVEYMGVDKATAFNKRQVDEIFAEYVRDHKDVSTERIIKTKAKDLRRSRLRGAKPKVMKPVRRDITIPAFIKRKTTRAFKTSVVVKGKRIVRHRDAKGRFVSARVPKRK